MSARNVITAFASSMPMGIRNGLVAFALVASGCGVVSEYINPKPAPGSFRSGKYDVEIYKNEHVEITSFYDGGHLKISHSSGDGGERLIVYTKYGACADVPVVTKQGVIPRCDAATFAAAYAAVEEARACRPAPVADLGK